MVTDWVSTETNRENIRPPENKKKRRKKKKETRNKNKPATKTVK